MPAYETYHFSLWWIFPLAMMLLCFLMMLGRKRGMGCCFTPRTKGRSRREEPSSAKELLDMRFASGEIDQEEYLAKKEIILGSGAPQEADQGESDARLP
ncbi:MAG: SHOCT domain-containing protein [Desulfarculaceae bacterium]|nr:SHOCT domain-containing protein [Desulfarculaceae bacterium]MCF8049563.1 SHOCT domain-containing protein [Desulfarculaceae bacterium]MCF8066840.1 SHOCT domain-containing protein [Desulfarculaceae bacterium]MCF8099901.1 SHOCT domain-containing protein [Desulfarculaceae bacterium]